MGASGNSVLAGGRGPTLASSSTSNSKGMISGRPLETKLTHTPHQTPNGTAGSMLIGTQGTWHVRHAKGQASSALDPKLTPPGQHEAKTGTPAGGASLCTVFIQNGPAGGRGPVLDSGRAVTGPQLFCPESPNLGFFGFGTKCICNLISCTVLQSDGCCNQ